MKTVIFGLIVLLAGNASSETMVGQSIPTICSEASKPSFEAAFNFMTSGGETCKKTVCNEDKSIFARNVYVEVQNDSSTSAALFQKVREFSALATEAISNVIGVNFIESFDEAESFIFVLIVSKKSISDLEAGVYPEIDHAQFSQFVKPALMQKKCAGMVRTLPDGTTNRIQRVIIFVPDQLDRDEEVQSCVYEEFMNASGLLRDPPGSASLFDDGNYRKEDGSFKYSVETLAMLYLHYSIAREEYGSVDDFLQKQCAKASP